MTVSIVDISDPVTLVGGSHLSPIVLNICLRIAPSVVAADGGADACLSAGLSPLAVIGDMDSLSRDARSEYAGVTHPVTEQDTTDFEKCITRVSAPLILGAGFLGGRVDHTLAVLNAVHRRQARHIVLLSEDDVIILLTGQAGFELPVGVRLALLPLSPVRVSTTGLRWNLDAAELSPGGLVSSSNAVADMQVRIRPEGPVFLALPLAQAEAAIAAVRAG